MRVVSDENEGSVHAPYKIMHDHARNGGEQYSCNAEFDRGGSTTLISAACTTEPVEQDEAPAGLHHATFRSSMSSTESATSGRSLRPQRYLSSRRHRSRSIVKNPLEDYAFRDYGHEIYKSMIENESRYMITQQLEPKTHASRTAGLQLIINLCLENDVSTSAMFLAVSMFNRFLATGRASRRLLPLAAAGCLFTASKFDDVYPIVVDRILEHFGYAVSQRDLYTMELHVLERLEFKISMATSCSFKDHLLMVLKSNRRTHCISAFLLELTLADPSFSKYLPSIVASSSICFARYLQDEFPPWPEKLQILTGIRVRHMRDCISSIGAAFNLSKSGICSTTVDRIVNKYSSKAWMQVAAQTFIRRDDL